MGAELCGMGLPFSGRDRVTLSTQPSSGLLRKALISDGPGVAPGISVLKTKDLGLDSCLQTSEF